MKIKSILTSFAQLMSVFKARPSDDQILEEVKAGVIRILSDWADNHPGIVHLTEAARGEVELLKACYLCAEVAIEKYKIPDLEIGITFKRDENGKAFPLVSVDYDKGGDEEQLVTDWRMYSSPADKSYEAFRDWIHSVSQRFGVEIGEVSEEVWQRKWREYWEENGDDKTD